MRNPYIFGCAMNEPLQEDLEDILKDASERSFWSNVHRARLAKIRERLGTISEIAEVLGVSGPTIRWWERKESKEEELKPPPPLEKLKRLRDLVIERHFRSLIKAGAKTGTDRPTGAAGYYEVFVRLRGFKEVMERAQYCQNYWVFRFGRPFKAGFEDQVFKHTANFVREYKTNIFLAYREPEQDDPEAPIYEAKKSFSAVSQRISEIKDESLKRAMVEHLRGVPLRPHEADKIGLVDPWISIVMGEYNDEGYRKYRRGLDVWTETLVEGSEAKEPVWLELPVAEAISWKQRRAGVLSEAVKRARGTAA